jgi:hypothetical protein
MFWFLNPLSLHQNLYYNKYILTDHRSLLLYDSTQIPKILPDSHQFSNIQIP